MGSVEAEPASLYELQSSHSWTRTRSTEGFLGPSETGRGQEENLSSIGLDPDECLVRTFEQSDP